MKKLKKKKKEMIQMKKLTIILIKKIIAQIKIQIKLE